MISIFINQINRILNNREIIKEKIFLLLIKSKKMTIKGYVMTKLRITTKFLNSLNIDLKLNMKFNRIKNIVYQIIKSCK